MRVIFLDRDKTLNEDPPPGYINSAEKVKLKENVLEGLRLLSLAGFQFIVITNQSGLERGFITEEELSHVHQKLEDLLQEGNISLLKIYYCPDKSDQDSNCRKPKPGMIEAALSEFPISLESSYIIGDRMSDIQTGESFSIPGILLEPNATDQNSQGQQSSEKNQRLASNLVDTASDLLKAAHKILQREYEVSWKDKVFLNRKDGLYVEKVDIWRLKDQRIVFTNGCFDIWHSGHLQYLFQASLLGEHLVIGLNSDSSVKKLKGEPRPIMNERERAEKLAQLPFISMIIVFEEDTPIDLIQELKPHIHVKGGDYEKTSLPEYEILKKMGAEIIILPYKAEHSTSKIIKQIRT